MCEQARLEYQSVDRLTVAHYHAVLADPECWLELGWPEDRQAVAARLDEIREIRNRVAHFNPDPPGEEDIDKLHLFLGLLRERHGG